MTYEHIVLEREDGVGIITLNRSARRGCGTTSRRRGRGWAYNARSGERRDVSPPVPLPHQPPADSRRAVRQECLRAPADSPAHLPERPHPPAEPMDHVRSASMYLMIPAGYVHEPADKLGLCGIFADVLTRGAGDRDSKRARRSPSTTWGRPQRVGRRVQRVFCRHARPQPPAVLRLYADVVRRPRLPATRSTRSRDMRCRS